MGECFADNCVAYVVEANRPEVSIFGWVYNFWNKNKAGMINACEVKGIKKETLDEVVDVSVGLILGVLV